MKEQVKRGQEKYRKMLEKFVKRVLERYKDKTKSSILFGSVVMREAPRGKNIVNRHSPLLLTLLLKMKAG